MKVTTRILIYLPKGSGWADVGEVGAVAAVAKRLGLSVVRERPYFFACDYAQPNGVGEEAAALFLDVYPGTAASRRRFAAAAGPEGGWPAWHAMAEREAQFYNLIEARGDAVRMESDPIGLKPFHLAELDHGVLVASRILDILRAFPDLARPVDPLALYQLMRFRAPMDERTLHRRIKRSVAGGCYAWDPGQGLRMIRARRLQAPPVDIGLLVDDALSAIRRALTRSLAEKTAGLAGPIALSLSGGFDSRLLAGVAAEIGLAVEVYSFGRRHHPEIRSARAAARALGLPLHLLPYPADGSIERLPLHLETAEGTADLATSLIANLFAIARPLGTPILHGFAGDPLAGNHLRHLGPQDYRSFDALADGVLRFNTGGAAADFAALFGRPAPTEAAREAIRSSLPESCAPHQAYLLWDFENKQRRYVGSHFPILGTRFDTIAPYYDRELFALWLSVPPVGLDNRALFRTFLARYYPALARIAHPEEPAPIVPNLRDQFARFLRQAPYTVADRTMGRGRARRIMRGRSRDPYIWSLANLAGTRQRAHMLSRIAALRPELARVLDLDLDARFADHLRADLQGTRALFLVAEYARWLRREIEFLPEDRPPSPAVPVDSPRRASGEEGSQLTVSA